MNCHSCGRTVQPNEISREETSCWICGDPADICKECTWENNGIAGCTKKGEKPRSGPLPW